MNNKQTNYFKRPLNNLRKVKRKSNNNNYNNKQIKNIALYKLNSMSQLVVRVSMYTDLKNDRKQYEVK